MTDQPRMLHPVLLFKGETDTDDPNVKDFRPKAQKVEPARPPEQAPTRTDTEEVEQTTKSGDGGEPSKPSSKPSSRTAEKHGGSTPLV